MKIILSRKGVDSSTGELASPIMPNGRLLSLPIPVTEEQKEKDEQGISYDELKFDGQCLSKVINQLSDGKFAYKEAHLDPDLDRDRLESHSQDWKPAFGQQGTAQAYLKNREVRKGDLFLFFGYFRPTRHKNGQLQYVRGSRKLHAIFGWLQVNEILEVRKNRDQDEFPNWLHYHPHIVNRDMRGYTNNTIYIAAEKLTVFGQGLGVRGAGPFPCFRHSLQLTAPKEKARSHWSLPKWLCRRFIEGNWPCHKDHLPFDSVGRRQEFVFDMPDCQESSDWIRSLFDG